MLFRLGTPLVSTSEILTGENLLLGLNNMIYWSANVFDSKLFAYCYVTNKPEDILVMFLVLLCLNQSQIIYLAVVVWAEDGVSFFLSSRFAYIVQY